ncbi:hypothetical protein SAMD00023353_8900180 [Rosellinia necatrix]|uniref:Uncharacterized protein n=1 Tax=Rosellinia necatrix TaxID=77044 RepID=A0A1S8AAT8_ROSNE|nr:hypothetical protein SAMD00023353_8900180 [Rosellinia necatrix]
MWGLKPRGIIGGYSYIATHALAVSLMMSDDCGFRVPIPGNHPLLFVSSLSWKFPSSNVAGLEFPPPKVYNYRGDETQHEAVASGLVPIFARPGYHVEPRVSSIYVLIPNYL